MKILVCVKQVPDTTQVKIDPVTNTLIREGVPAIINPFDGFAVEAAARIKDKMPETQIVALSMGPENAKTALKECLASAADRAYLVSSRAFGGSDTLATSYILSQAVRKIEQIEGPFDAVFCGKQAIDGDTAQVGPELAEHLGYPQITCALDVLDCDSTHMEVLKEGQDANMVMSTGLPCVITFTKSTFELRYPTIKRKLAANKAQIPTLSELDFPQIDTTRIGLKGSPTRVKRSFVPVKKSNAVMIRENDPEKAVAMLLAGLADKL